MGKPWCVGYEYFREIVYNSTTLFWFLNVRPAVTPMQMHWSYCSLALSHRYYVTFSGRKTDLESKNLHTSNLSVGLFHASWPLIHLRKKNCGSCVKRPFQENFNGDIRQFQLHCFRFFYFKAKGKKVSWYKMCCIDVYSKLEHFQEKWQL